MRGILTLVLSVKEMEQGGSAHESVLPTRLLHNFPDISAIYQRLPLMCLSTRKELLTACRVQQPPSINPRLRKEMHLWSSSYYPDPSLYNQTRAWRSLEPALSSILSSPIQSAILSMALRGEPLMTDGGAREAIQSGIEKEVRASIEARYPSIDWTPLFSTDPNTLQDATFIPNGPSRPHLYLQLRARLSRWKEKITDKLLVPQMSHKSMGLESSTALHMCLPDAFKAKKPRLYTTIEAETFYSDHGYLPEGPCEMRLAWKFNDLKPRVYYAQGLSAYTSSRYVHDIFDSLQRVCQYKV
jgi:hypothetical protein